MAQEEKAKRYDEAIERAKKWYFDAQIGIGVKANLEKLFPELKEYEDEKIRKELIDFINRVYKRQALIITDEEKDNWITWLEKQDEQKTIEEVNGEDYGIDGLWHAQRILEKTLGSVNGYQSDDGILDHKAAITAVKKLYKQEPVDKVEPKFPEGEWITTEDYTWKIISIDNLDYTLQNQCGEYVYDTVDYVNKAFHLWTIQDAKDGDVLCTYECNEPKIVFILKGTPKKHYALSYHCYYNIMYPHFGSDSEKGCLAPNDEDVKPATKEQRDLLFTKMKEAGYEWDADKKELRKEEVK